MTYYKHNGDALTKEELLDLVLSVWEEDREGAKEIVERHEIWWQDVIEHQEGSGS